MGWKHNDKPGWGGPAKGAGNGSAPVPLTEAGPGQGHMSIRGMAKAERIQRWREALDAIAMDTSHNQQAAALMNLLDRDEGKPATRIEGGDPDKPVTMRIERVIIDPANPDSAGLLTAAGTE